MAWYGGKQKAALKLRHKPKPKDEPKPIPKEVSKRDSIIDLGDGFIADFSNIEIIEEKVEKVRFYVGKNSK